MRVSQINNVSIAPMQSPKFKGLWGKDISNGNKVYYPFKDESKFETDMALKTRPNARVEQRLALSKKEFASYQLGDLAANVHKRITKTLRKANLTEYVRK